MKIIFTILIIALALNSTTSTCGGTCQTSKSFCYKYSKTSCSPAKLASNPDTFSLFFKEKYDDYNVDSKKYGKSMSKLKEEYNDLYNYMYSLSEEQTEYASNIKKNGKSYLKEIEKSFNDGQSGYSEFTEMTEEFSHVVESGSSYTKEVDISGEGLGGKLMALSSTIDDDPAFAGKLLSKNPTNASRALLLFNPGCGRGCGNKMIGLYSIWNQLQNKCWAYFLKKKLKKQTCRRKKSLMKKYLRGLCRPYGMRLTRDFLKYWDYLMGPSICSW